MTKRTEVTGELAASQKGARVSNAATRLSSSWSGRKTEWLFIPRRTSLAISLRADGAVAVLSSEVAAGPSLLDFSIWAKQSPRLFLERISTWPA